MLSSNPSLEYYKKHFHLNHDEAKEITQSVLRAQMRKGPIATNKDYKGPYENLHTDMMMAYAKYQYLYAVSQALSHHKVTLSAHVQKVNQQTLQSLHHQFINEMNKTNRIGAQYFRERHDRNQEIHHPKTASAGGGGGSKEDDGSKEGGGGSKEVDGGRNAKGNYKTALFGNRTTQSSVHSGRSHMERMGEHPHSAMIARHFDSQSRGALAQTSRTMNKAVEDRRNIVRAHHHLSFQHVSSKAARLIATIPVGQAPRYAVAHGHYLYVLNDDSKNISVVNMQTIHVDHKIPVGLKPQYAVAHGHTLYMAGDRIGALNLQTNELLQTIDQGGTGFLSNMATYGNFLYFLPYNARYGVGVIDMTNNKIIHHIRNPLGPSGLIYLVKNKDILYAIGHGHNNIEVINMHKNKLDTTIYFSPGSLPVFALVHNHNLYVLNHSASSVNIVNMQTNHVDHTIHVGEMPKYAVAHGHKLYVVNSGSDTVSVISLAE